MKKSEAREIAKENRKAPKGVWERFIRWTNGIRN